MPFYDSADQLYHCLRTLFGRLGQENPGAGEAVLALRLISRLRISEPAAEITTNGRRRPLLTVYGPSTLRPDLEIEVVGDTLHRILLGELPLKKAVGNGLVKVRGPAWKTLALAELFRQSQAIYPEVLRELGFTRNAGRR